ncbi:MAG: CapA family protein [Kiritimatiellae bacterium]|nr:CapA family protein [Kiritimatiellia bacterium]
MILLGDCALGNKRCQWSAGDDIVLTNLEGPLLPPNHFFSPMPKAGPSLFACEAPTAVATFVFALANNHIMDFGVRGLEETLKSLDARGIRSCGAGKNIHAARESVIVNDKGVDIGIISCCEAQFGVSRRDTAGVAEFGPWVYRAIRQLRTKVDAVIVSVHAAIEDSPWPSLYIRELYHSFIDAGAAVVHGHHSHVPQGYEAYGEGVIFYGMGNFAVDPDKWLDVPNGLWSLGAEIDFTAKPLRWRPLIFVIRQRTDLDTVMIEGSTPEEQIAMMSYLELCNRPLNKPELLEALWQEVALRSYYRYGAVYMGFHVPFLMKLRACVSKHMLTIKNMVSGSAINPARYDYLMWYHMVACESHRQMLATALGVLCGEIRDLRTNESHLLADEMLPWSCGRS